MKATITDEQGNPLEYATAALYNSNGALVSGVVSEANGAVEIDNIKSGKYNLVVSFIGYEVSKTANILFDDVLNLGTIKLTLGNQLDNVVISTKRKTIINKIDKQIFDSQAFKNAQGGTGIDVLKNLPAVSFSGNGELMVRGSSGFVVLVNGKPTQSNPTAIMAQLPANAISSIELITAPSAKYDPEGKAGIINIITDKGATEGVFSQLSLKGGFPSIETYGNELAHERFGIDGTYNVNSEKLHVSIGANYQRNDLGGRREGNVYTIIDDVFTGLPSTGERSFDETNYNGRFTLEYTPNTSNELSVGFYAGKRSKKRLADIVYYNNQKITPNGSNNITSLPSYFNHNLRERKSDFILGNIDYARVFQNNSELSLSILYEYTLLGGPTVNQNLGHPDNSVLHQDEYNTNDNPLYGLRAQLDYVFSPFKGGEVAVGYQFRNLDHKGDFLYERRTSFNDPFVMLPAFSSEVNLVREIHAVYGQLSASKGAFSYNAGIRIEQMNRDLMLRDKANTIDDTRNYAFTKAYPSASISYAVNENTKAKLAYSKRVARTTTFKMNPFPEREHAETLEQGDPDLRPEFIDLIELGIDKKLSEENSFFATAYYRSTKNVINRVNTVYSDNILNRIYSNVGDAKTFGVEFGTQLKLTAKSDAFIGGNIYHYNLNGSFDNNPVNTNTTVYSFNANANYRFWENATLQFSINYISDRVTAQGEDSRYYTPNLSIQKSFLNDKLKATLQWLNIDMGLLDTNEQRITTWRENEFYTTTNYIYEVDMITLNLSYIFQNGKNRSKFIESEFGKREF
ncbi:MAG: TonB-dependent receptor [Flavobacteriaceae bacterium]|nr:TonB-dependent receptor [Flavobacteriaceae bacterium]MDG2290517.1 TonB-dependent receptor [Flavobacteriaceae bacterium]